jgi:hypothetical protein
MNGDAAAYLRDLRSAARRVSGRIEGLCRPLGAVALGWKPAPDAWSAAQILEHVVRTADPYLERIRKAIERSRARGVGESPPLRPRFLARLFLRLVGPDSRRRLPAPKPFRPVVHEASPQILDRFLESQLELEELITSAEGCDLNRPRFASPITPLVRFSAGEALTILVRHAERHAQQIERVVAAHGALSSRGREPS